MDKPLLSSEEDDDDPFYVKKTPIQIVVVKWILKTLIWVIFISWVILIFLFPVEFMKKFYNQWIQHLSRSPFGITGGVFVVFSGPILVISFLSILDLIISGEEEFQKHRKKSPRIGLRTFPVVVDGAFGVVSAAELIGILVFILYIIWAVSVYTVQDLNIVSDYQLPFMEKCYKMLKRSGLHFGSIGVFCLAFLFLPIARGSLLLRLIDIPFEHATRYHVWLGHLTIFIFTLHGLFYIIAWAMQGRLLQHILQWKDIGVANLAGVITLLAGLLMWVTSLSPVRKQHFELFFYTHQLYILFVIFLVLHVGDFIFSICAGGIFLFIVDRFLRFCQSRTTVKIISATCFPCGTMELVISKPGNLRYNALSSVLIQIRELSWLQWHPFSVSSSPLDGKYHLTVLIKVLGEWTENLRAHILGISKEEPINEPPLLPYSDITASVEGPYGHESPYHLMYENLILVAGGIGISPFLAILSDISHRIKEEKYCMPKNILLVWAIKRSDELSLLSAIDLESVSPHRLNIEISTYVTRESESPLEEGKICNTMNSFVIPVSKGCGMSVLVGTGNHLWYGIYVISSTVGLVILVGLLDIYYINPCNIHAWWYKGLLFGACMIASIFIFGGIVVGLWHLWERRITESELCEEGGKKISTGEHYEPLMQRRTLSLENTASLNTIHYGCRPDFQEIFGTVSENWGHVDVGVIVCGPSTLQSSVAKECRSRNFKGTCKQPVFHFNSLSFDL